MCVCVCVFTHRHSFLFAAAAAAAVTVSIFGFFLSVWFFLCSFFPFESTRIYPNKAISGGGGNCTNFVAVICVSLVFPPLGLLENEMSSLGLLCLSFISVCLFVCAFCGKHRKAAKLSCSLLCWKLAVKVIIWGERNCAVLIAAADELSLSAGCFCL